jgi:hypothetical protein
VSLDHADSERDWFIFALNSEAQRLDKIRLIGPVRFTRSTEARPLLQLDDEEFRLNNLEDITIGSAQLPGIASCTSTQ